MTAGSKRVNGEQFLAKYSVLSPTLRLGDFSPLIEKAHKLPGALTGAESLEEGRKQIANPCPFVPSVVKVFLSTPGPVVLLNKFVLHPVHPAANIWARLSGKNSSFFFPSSGN